MMLALMIKLSNYHISFHLVILPLRKKYYVTFIDDYSKFTWIYLLHHKSDIFKIFLEFRSLVE
jgi:hypothetical protein